MSNQWLYRRHDVLRRLETGEAVVYRCFELIPDGGYIVQSADRVKLPLVHDVLEQHERQFWELFCEAEPMGRGKPCATLEEAIIEFEKAFDGT